jgi:hypothetical protein
MLIDEEYAQLLPHSTVLVNSCADDEVVFTRKIHNFLDYFSELLLSRHTLVCNDI